jgi:hypothetical protein
MPAIDINMLPVFPDLDGMAKGIAISIVNKAIEIMVPMEKNIRNRIPDTKSFVVGNIASITAALPAKPCTIPIKYDFNLKNGMSCGNKPCDSPLCGLSGTSS